MSAIQDLPDERAVQVLFEGLAPRTLLACAGTSRLSQVLVQTLGSMPLLLQGQQPDAAQACAPAGGLF